MPPEGLELGQVNKLIFLILAVCFTLAVLALTTFVGVKGVPESRFTVRPDDNTLLFVVTPWGDPKQVKEAYRPLLSYLSLKTGKKFQLLVMEDYDVAIDNLVEGNIDISVTSPVSYIIAKEREPGLQYIATIERENEGRRFATFKGHIVALRSNFKGWTIDRFMADPKRYKMGFVTKTSASGWTYPMAMFKKRGIDPFKEFAAVTIYENHPEMTSALVAGQIDIGATWEYNLETEKKKRGDIFEIVYTTPDIPGLSWIASKKMDPEFVEELRGLLAEISRSDSLRGKLLKETPDKGWAVVDGRFYDEVRDVMKYIDEFK